VKMKKMAPFTLKEGQKMVDQMLLKGMKPAEVFIMTYRGAEGKPRNFMLAANHGAKPMEIIPCRFKDEVRE
jgi:hypothetical protein